MPPARNPSSTQLMGVRVMPPARNSSSTQLMGVRVMPPARNSSSTQLMGVRVMPPARNRSSAPAALSSRPTTSAAPPLASHAFISSDDVCSNPPLALFIIPCSFRTNRWPSPTVA